MKHILILIILILSLSAQTNDTVNIFYKNTWQMAWQSPGKAYLNSKGHISFPHDDVVLARFEIFNHWFMPHPHSNRFHDIILKLETEKIDLEFKLDNSRKRNKKMLFVGMGMGSAILLIPAIIIKILQ